MRSEIISELENEYARRREKNERLADERLAKAEEKIPGLAEALAARHELIFSGVKNILSQQKEESLPDRMRGINLQIAALLTGAGYPEKWLDPIYTCARCQDTGYVGETRREMCECMRGEFYRRLEQAVGLKERENQSFETWDESCIPDVMIEGAGTSQRQLSRWLRDECRDWVAVWPDTPWHTLVLTGESGLGKTFLMHAMAKELLRRQKDVLLMSAYTALEQMRRAWFDRDEDALRTLTDTEVLMLDDFGTEPMLNNVTIEQLHNLLTERERQGNALVVSTNLTPKEIREHYNERIASRLLDSRHSLVMEFRGEDIRRPRGSKTGGSK